MPLVWFLKGHCESACCLMIGFKFILLKTMTQYHDYWTYIIQLFDHAKLNGVWELKPYIMLLLLSKMQNTANQLQSYDICEKWTFPDRDSVSQQFRGPLYILTCAYYLYHPHTFGFYTNFSRPILILKLWEKHYIYYTPHFGEDAIMESVIPWLIDWLIDWFRITSNI